MNNLFSCLWFNEVHLLTPRDQLSFGYVVDRLKWAFKVFMFHNCDVNTTLSFNCTLTSDNIPLRSSGSRVSRNSKGKESVWRRAEAALGSGFRWAATSCKNFQSWLRQKRDWSLSLSLFSLYSSLLCIDSSTESKAQPTRSFWFYFLIYVKKRSKSVCYIAWRLEQLQWCYQHCNP